MKPVYTVSGREVIVYADPETSELTMVAGKSDLFAKDTVILDPKNARRLAKRLKQAATYLESEDV